MGYLTVARLSYVQLAISHCLFMLPGGWLICAMIASWSLILAYVSASVSHKICHCILPANSTVFDIRLP